MPPLRVHPENPRYFMDGAGRAVLLAGSHHWDVLVDGVAEPGAFDFEGYLDRLSGWGHSFIRLWTHEAWLHEIGPLPFLRSGPGLARDGGLRFDLGRFDPEYFARLRQRVERAAARGFYVGVVLFNGWSIHSKGFGNPWDRHPFNRENNVNGVDGDPDARGEGSDVHTLRIEAVLRVQEAYVRKVAETLGDLDAVLWEISNESPGESLPWQLRWLRLLREIEGPTGRIHPIGLTACFPGGRNEQLFDSPADWIAPANARSWREDPPPAAGGKVVLLDTDHLWGVGGDSAWIWKAVLRGYHPVYMDPLDADPVREGARRAMGQALALGERIDLARMTPNPRIASSGYALADLTGNGKVVAYLPGGRGSLDLRGLDGTFRLEWLEPRSGEGREGGEIAGGSRTKVASPWDRAAVLEATGLPRSLRPVRSGGPAHPR
jgi:hypothetical protein